MRLDVADVGRNESGHGECTPHGVHHGGRPHGDPPVHNARSAAAKHLNKLAADGQWKPQVDRVFPLAEAAAAHRLQEENTLGKAGTLHGKIVLEP